MTNYAKFRTARASDLSYILAREADSSNQFIHRWDETTHTANMADNNFHYLIAQDPMGKILGYAILKDNQDGRIEWRRVVIGAPGKGVGKAFMADVLAYFMNAGKNAIWLDVYENNVRARHVYTGLNFKETHREPSPSNPENTLVFMEYQNDHSKQTTQ